MHECKQFEKLSALDKEIAVVNERNKALENHVKEINDSVKQMQKWIMGFIIAVMLTGTGYVIKDTMHGTKANAKEIVKNGK